VAGLGLRLAAERGEARHERGGVPAEAREAPVEPLLEHDIEIGGGLGPLAGKVWRVGLMGEGSRQESVLAVLAALEHQLRRGGRSGNVGVSTTAALEAYARG